MEKKICLKTPIFNIEELSFGKKDTSPVYPGTYYRVDCPDWVNILALTEQNQKAILIRQYRVGVEKDILETPGGLVEPSESKDPTMTAARELEEETGYSSKNILSLGESFPNPAMQTNRIHFFLALNCMPPEQRKHFPDLGEDISVELFDVKDLEQMVRYGRIEHCLSAFCVLLAMRHLNK
jgi:ADP-ribose pyrophosphatase